MTYISNAEYTLLKTLYDIINTQSNHYNEFQDEYVSMVHQIYSILQRKYKFNLKDDYISDPYGEILSRSITSAAAEPVESQAIR